MKHHKHTIKLAFILSVIILGITAAFAATQRNLVVKNIRSVGCEYQISDYNKPVGQAILATGHLGPGETATHPVTTFSDTSGDTHYYYRILPSDEKQWRSWNGKSSSNGVLELN